jgi:hypothetical protein
MAHGVVSGFTRIVGPDSAKIAGMDIPKSVSPILPIVSKYVLSAIPLADRRFYWSYIRPQ